MNSKRDWIFVIATVLTFLMVSRIVKKAIRLGATIFLILVVLLMLLLLNHM